MTPNTEDKQTNATDADASSPLMKLPAELRTSIYEYALQLDNDGYFSVSQAEGIREPALLLTSKTIRREALAIFYAQNSISLLVDSYSPAMPLFIYKKQLAVFAQYKFKIAVRQVYSQGPPRWRNLLAWLRHAHEYEYVGVPFVRPGAPLGTRKYCDWAGDPIREGMVVAGLFQMVAVMDDAEWEDVEETLRMLRYGLVKFDPEWEVE